MSSGSGDKRRVQFRAPRDLVERTDVLATVLDTDRTDVIISAVREYLRDAAHDELKQEIAEAYYSDDISFEQLKNLVGHEEAANFHVLKTQLSDEFLNDAEREFADS
ncbi:MAG: hypothetical protein V5A39_08695 [Haloarculaceae archaeon]